MSTRPKETCRYCSTMLYEKVEWLDEITSSASVVEEDGREHTVARCRDVASNRMRQLEHGRGAGHCGYQWGSGAQNHGGGCEEEFEDCEAVYRCLNCGGVFHKHCLEKHFTMHSGATPEALRAALRTAVHLAETCMATMVDEGYDVTAERATVAELGKLL